MERPITAVWPDGYVPRQEFVDPVDLVVWNSGEGEQTMRANPFSGHMFVFRGGRVI